MHVDVGEWLIQQQNLADHAESLAPATSSAACLANIGRRPRQLPDRAPPRGSLPRSAHRRQFHRAGRSSADSPCRSFRRRAVTDAPCIRCRAKPSCGAFPENRNLSLGRVRQSCKRSQQRRLPCSVVAEDCVETSRVKLGRNAAQCGEASELLDDVADGDDGGSRDGHRDQWPDRVRFNPESTGEIILCRITMWRQPRFQGRDCVWARRFRS